MPGASYIEGFSRLGSDEKALIIADLTARSKEFIRSLEDHKHPDVKLQELYRNFSENNLSDFHLPYGIAPNFLINDKVYHVPMVIEESSVVAAAASAAKFWSKLGGFKCVVKSTIKKGHIHFMWEGLQDKLFNLFNQVREQLLDALKPVVKNMVKRGGGIIAIDLIPKPDMLKNYYQLEVSFETKDSMGANFINTCLESIASEWKSIVEHTSLLDKEDRQCEIVMSILTNYTPDCIVECQVSTKVRNMAGRKSMLPGEHFVSRFIKAVHIAGEDVYRAVTHNKGIYNGIDAVVVATGNDYRATEANGHAYAARDGKYRGLSKAWIEGDDFYFRLEIPIALGTIGGLTKSHPLAAYSLEILGNPDAKELMQITAAVGLASNYSAIRALITTGIQQGHMKLHLSNILHQLGATENEIMLITQNFRNESVSYSQIREFLDTLRKS